MSPCVLLRKVSKVYRLYRNPKDRLKELLGLGRRHREFWALKDVDLEVLPGESLGIIGRNGSGKSTLLQIIAGTLQPTTGEVDRRGRIAALLELGIGFHPELTGRENIRMVSSLMQVDWSPELEREVIEFAEIGEFVDQPVKTYSSGMFVRLAFSLAVSVDPDILVIDEALSVGDHYFQKKSFDRILSFREKGKTLIFCSHSMYHINQLCNRVLWLDSGRVRMEGPTALVTSEYEQWSEEISKRVSVVSRQGYRGKVDIKLVNTSGEEKNGVEMGEPFSVQIAFSSPFDRSHVGLCIYKGEFPVFVTSTQMDGIPALGSSGLVRWRIKNNPLLPGKYKLMGVLLDETGNIDLRVEEKSFVVRGNTKHIYGVVLLEGEWEL